MLAVCLLGVLAALFLVWPVWRATLPLEVYGNEGWNAYNVDAAMGARALYPPPEGLIANNYPPLSFYVIGGLGHAFGDALYVGRVLSLLATLALGAITAAIVQGLNGSRCAAAIGGLWFIATMARFFNYAVGMNEPHLLAQAIMAAGLAWFLARCAAGRAVEPAVLVMVLAGFFKHNIVAIPVAAFVWLALHDWHRALRAAVVGAGAAALGLVVCAFAYADFIADMLLPRTYHLDRALYAIGRLEFVFPALVIWGIWAWIERKAAAARFTALFIAVALLCYLVQKAGAGVHKNVQFELVLAAAVGVGIACDRLPIGALTMRWSSQRIRLTVLAVLALRLIAFTHLEFAYVLFSPDYRALAAELASVTRAEVAKVAAMPSAVACSNLVVCRMAGKPFVFDHFKVEMLRHTGKLSEAALAAALRQEGIVFAVIDPRANVVWLSRRCPLAP
jgi:hypothetical protein